MVSPSLTAMPADSWPRCCRANMPSKVSWATALPGAYTPKTPQASFTGPSSSLPSLRRTFRGSRSPGASSRRVDEPTFPHRRDSSLDRSWSRSARWARIARYRARTGPASGRARAAPGGGPRARPGSLAAVIDLHTHSTVSDGSEPPAGSSSWRRRRGARRWRSPTTTAWPGWTRRRRVAGRARGPARAGVRGVVPQAGPAVGRAADRGVGPRARVLRRARARAAPGRARQAAGGSGGAQPRARRPSGGARDGGHLRGRAGRGG